ncbi:MAG: potassium transporter Kef [Desulfuromonas sp.]|nr:MAG: potassium transporter Kef [Desulfuromonas sp.]
MDPLIISISAAFVFGFVARQVGLPPLVGFLAAGFILNAFGVEPGKYLDTIADLGVTLLLFSIGLKLRLKSLKRPEVWCGASVHMAITILVFGCGLYLLKLSDLPYFQELTLPLVVMVAFALSFSSTVFAVKILEERGGMDSIHGRASIGILIVQDIFAVIFLVFSLGKLPSAWAILIPLVLFAIKPVLYRLMDQSGHGELLLLFGLFVALVVGAGGFELVGIKADLGALILGGLLAQHEKSSELAKNLMGLKELFLVGFFLKIGLSGLPSMAAIGVSAILVGVVVFKAGTFFLLLTRFRLRARSSLLASLSLANYSEFGLIVAAVGTSQGWLNPEWLVIISMALAATFVIAAPLNSFADALYVRYREKLCRFETNTRHPDDQPIQTGDTTIGVFGMGRIGTKAYDFLREQYGNTVIGFDSNAETVAEHCQEDRRVVFGDPTDPDFLNRIRRRGSKARLALLAMSEHRANISAAKHLIDVGFPGKIIAIAHFDDQVQELEEAGVHAAFNMYKEAGIGFAEYAWKNIEEHA